MLDFSINADPQFVRNRQFHDACRTGDIATARSLLEENPTDTYMIDNVQSDQPAILAAAWGQHWELCKMLITHKVVGEDGSPRDAGVNLNVSNRHGFAPLHAFALFGQDELVALAVENAAYLHKGDMNGQRALHFAARGGHLSTCELLVKLGADVNSLTRQKNSPLHVALKGPDGGERAQANAQKAAMAAMMGDDPGSTPGLSPEEQAELDRRLTVARFLVEKGAHVHGENEMGETPITLAPEELREDLESIALTRAVAEAEKAQQAASGSAPAADGSAPAPAVEQPKPKRRILKA